MSALARFGAPALLVTLVLVAFAPAFEAGFVSFDDLHNFQQNHRFRGLGSEQLTWMFSTGHMGHYHPLTWISLGLDYIVAGGLEPAVFHRTNVILHALAAVTFFFVARRVLLLVRPESSGTTLGALSAALLFAVHPLRVESVAWITERRDVLAGLLLLASSLCWLRWVPEARAAARSPAAAPAALGLAALGVGALALSVDLSRREALEWGPLGPLGLAAGVLLLAGSVAAASRAAGAASARWLALACAALTLSLFSKAWGIVLPAVLLVLDAWPLRRLAGERPLRRWGLLLAEKAPLLAGSLVFMRLAGWAQASQGGTMLAIEDHGLVERAAQGFYGLAFYAWKTVLPLGLMPIYELPAVLSFAQPRFLLPAVLVVLVTVLLVALRRRCPAGLAAWLIYAAILSPVLGVAQSGPQLVADRYSYLACLPLVLLVGAGVAQAPRRAAVVALALAVALSTLATYRRTEAWHSSTTLWEAAYEVNPRSPMTLLSLGVAREEEAASEPDPARRKALLLEATDLLQRGFELRPGPRYLGNLSRVHGQLARVEPERKREHRLEALAYSERALKMASRRKNVPPDYKLNLAVDLMTVGRAQEALSYLEDFVARRPYDFRGRLNHGTALGLVGRHAEAALALERATTLEPRSADAWGKLGVALEGSKRIEEARQAYRRVLQIEPGHPVAARRLRQL